MHTHRPTPEEIMGRFDISDEDWDRAPVSVLRALRECLQQSEVAPDLLAALQALFANCEMVHRHWGENSNQREADNAISAARAAIARATS